MPSISTPTSAPRCDTPPRACLAELARPEPAYAVVLHNDALNAIDHVARTVASVLSMAPSTAWGLASRAHRAGSVVLWTGAAAKAQRIARRLTAAGPDPIMCAFGAQPLDIDVVPLARRTPPAT